jgi:putative two-component system hydrogenase maturation factor HypX/HoxX
LAAYRVEELAEMSRDIFDDRNGFAAARQAFVMKEKSTGTPEHLLSPGRLALECDRAEPDLYHRTGT